MTGTHSRNRRLPFLHRNWIRATNHWNTKMGNNASSPSRDAVDKCGNGEDRCQHSNKRPRIDNDYDGFPLFEPYATIPRALRIELLKVCHKDAPRVKNGILNGLIPPNVKDTNHFRVRCSIKVTCRRGDEDVVLHADSQLCDVNMFKNPAGSSPMARFSSIQPFYIPEDKISLEHDEGVVFGLADSYQVVIRLESGGGINWPPNDLLPPDNSAHWNDRRLPLRQWAFTATIVDIYNRNRKTIRLKLKKTSQGDEMTDFSIDVDVRWFTPVSTQLARGKDIKQSITVSARNETVLPPINGVVNGNSPTKVVNGVNGTDIGVNGVNGANGHQQDHIDDHGLEYLANGEADKLPNGITNGAFSELPDDLAEGEVTPSRTRRPRPEINYNVKHIWNTAVGKEPKKRRRLDDEIDQPDEQSITYLLPPEQVHTEKLACLICGAENERITQLRAHCQSHPQYDFYFQPRDARTKGELRVQVTPSATNLAQALRPKVYQLGLPVKPLDLDKYVEGDLSWVTSRLGPDDDHEIIEKFVPARVPKKLASKRSKKKIVVPNIKQPLFDPLSKAQLVPGAEIRQHPVDDSWLLLKHRDSLQDFLDVDPGEKEYMQEWDSFVLNKHISSEQYLPRVFVGFVKEKAGWIVPKRSRLEEFSKHVSMLLARRAINEASIFEATKIINEARTKNSGEAPKVLPRHNVTGGCNACGKPVPVSAMLSCSIKACKKRLYHVDCVDGVDEEVLEEKTWVCGKCS
ncbi:hypothetical protein B0T24DRAFT_319028 [Lasiosphaeria ovina]|uniref:Zinc finger PHD-type domain-containing protein n=1 Tax=Lasiosphaeria ovina TaxID=92902 RepID=A0AAE0N6M6_9PEZI|nr:hypothetical protein B0T24DRAFT_319028 [Lasiosphaeria ovina]